MQKTVSFYLAFLFFSLHCSIGQEIPTVVPPSPEAASLGKFTEVPVSLYTGLPNISVPITTYEVGGKSFPVSLSYHARGIKVNEIASRVGIGWALNAGGAITRQTRHVPDDEAPYGYLRPGNLLIPKLASEDWFTSNAARLNFLSQTAQLQTDTDQLPDMFQLQANTVSAKFIFDYNAPSMYEPILQQYEDLKITCQPDVDLRIASFVVTDAEGFKYYFGISKDGLRKAQNWDQTLAIYTFPLVGSYNSTSPGSFFKTYNTWHLMDIESPHGELVSFEYGSAEVSEYYRRSYDERNGPNVYNYTAKVSSYQYQLQKIVHTGGEIVFEKFPTNDREDLKGSYALQKISIYDNDLNFVKAFELNQSYQTALNGPNQNNELKNLEPEAAKRLFLDSVVEMGKNGVTKPPYTFTYNNQKLPNRFSNSQDYWGYYNGASNGEFLTFSDYSTFTMDRKVHIQNSRAGMLERITYPTGGSARFTYEHNKGVLGWEHRSIFLPDINPVNGDNTYGSALAHLMYQMPEYYDGSKYSRTFTIGQNLIGSLDYSIRFQDDTNCGETVHIAGCRFDVYLEKSGGSPSYRLLNGNHTIYNISPGTYTLTVIPKQPGHDPINNTDDHFTVYVSWKEQLNETQLYAAGKRIQKISYFNNDGSPNPEYSKEYEYGIGSILGVSSFYNLQNTPDGPFHILEPLGAVPGSPLSTYQGNSIGYPMVTEYHGSKDANTGKTVYSYTNQKDTGDYTAFPYHPPTDNEWLRGLPYRINEYRRDPVGSYTLVKRTDYEYLYGNHFISGTNTPTGIPLVFTPPPNRLDKDQNMIFGSALNDNGLPYTKTRTMCRLPLIHLYFPDTQAELAGELDYKVFYFTGGTMNRFSITETIYHDGVSLTNRNENAFNYPSHYQISRTLNNSSDAESIIKKYTYPQDTPGATGTVGNLNAAHRYEPIETRTYKDLDEDGNADANELIGFEKVIYGWNNGVLQPEKMQYAKNSTLSLEDRIIYHNYNDLGKPLEVSKADGPRTSYIWGYDKQYPIAKIENASYTGIASALGISESALRNYNETHLTALNGLRTHPSLQNAMVTTYTYDPLVGMTSMTDPRGHTLQYEYDGHNRLKAIKDQDGNLVEEYKYNYKNQ